jgi:hypothetical protein
MTKKQFVRAKKIPEIKRDDPIGDMTEDELILKGTGGHAPKNVLNAEVRRVIPNVAKEVLPPAPPPSDVMKKYIADAVVKSHAETLTRIMLELGGITLDNSAAQNALVAARMLLGNALAMLE